MDETAEAPRPVPRPRRNIPNLTLSQYENVTIDSINKNILINDQNLQSETQSKVPNNKAFPSTTEDKDNNKCILTETNNLANSDKNQNVQSVEVRPIPAPRRPPPNNNTEQIYENAQQLSPKSTGAISKTQNVVVRKAPEVPKSVNAEPEVREKPARTSPRPVPTPEYPLEFSESRAKLKKSVSNSTLDSSISSTSSTSDSQKYKNPSPGQLLKSIGSTSKLLTEAITERVTHKAKNILDKNFKTSQEKISTWGSQTTSRLKNVRQKINNLNINNLSLSRNEKRDPDFDLDRPQTLPPNDQVFQSISFNSPLNKASNLSNLATIESSYEIPRSMRSPGSYPIDGAGPPSYDDSIRGLSYSLTDPDQSIDHSFERNTSMTQSLNIHHPIEKPLRANRSPVAMNRSVPDIPNLVIKEEQSEDTHSSSEGLPMPNYPPPVLKHENIYGKINLIEPPARTKRKKIYETIEIRKPHVEASSNRATIDSIEIRETIDDSSRDVSRELNELITANEKILPKPDRSESWTYHENNDDECSSPEPIYANQESTYGRLCEMESDDVDVPLTPKPDDVQRATPTEDVLTPLASTPKSPSPKEILYEFDPLLKNRGNTIGKGMNKSNQLLLLENLLEEDTYGTVNQETSAVDDQSIDSSDDDNGIASSIPPPPKRMDSLAESTSTNQPEITRSDNMQIVHQNPHLRSDSLENIIEEQDMDAYLARTDNNPTINEEVDLSRPSQPRSQWFVDDAASQPRINPFNKQVVEKGMPDKLPPGVPPPSYSEAMASATTKNSTKNTDNKFPPMPASAESQPKTSMKSMFSNVFNKMESLKRKTSFRGTRSSDVHIILEMVPKPTLSQRMVLHEGHLIRLPSGGVEDILKEMQNRVAYLRDRKFVTFVDKDMKNQKETFSLEHITTIQCVSNHKFSNNSMQMYCFEITTAIPKNQSSQQQLSNPNMVMTNTNSGNKKLVRSCHLYGVAKESERDIWMHKLIESLTNVFPRNLTCKYYRAGWCYLKSSITAQWSGAWLLLQKRKRRLIYYCESDMNTEKLDLRKARWINLKESDDSIKNLHVESGPMLMVDCPPYSIYMIMSSSRETKIWRHIIREVAHNNGPALHEQQLTKYNVPVLVDKCINFVYIHGSMTEGIYRKSGSTAAIQKLMGLFRTDAFSVEMTRNEYSEHDVSNVLKRFMRSLPQTLLSKHAASFISITKLNSKVERITAYKELLNRLSDIEYQTLKKLIGHLAFIQSQKSKNKMSVDNLAMVWGPTLFQNSTSDEMGYSQNEADVVSDLITLYKNLYQLTPDEVVKEQEMLACLQKYYAAAENLADSLKQSGDLKVWITLNANPENTKEEKTQINVTLTPTKTAYEVCRELAARMKLSAHQITLNEVILNDSLERPLHHSERVFDIVLRWSYWPEADRKNNYLVVKPIKTIHEINRALKHLPTTTLSTELKFSDNKTKSLKVYQLELNDGKITVLKREKGLPTVVKEISLNDVTAYIGCEKKRDCQCRWAITLIEKSNNKVLRSRDLPYIGHVIAGTECHDQIIWLSAIWDSLYRDDIMPPGEIIIP